MNLSIGSGCIRRPGWMSLDASTEHGPDILATVPPLPESVTSQRWDEIEMVHFLEHLYPWDAAELLKQLRGVLVPGGKVSIEVPDLGFAARVLAGTQAPLTGTPMQCDMWVLYGNPEFREPFQMHRWGYTPETLAAALREAGFTEVELLPARYHLAGRDFRAEAR